MTPIPWYAAKFTAPGVVPAANEPLVPEPPKVHVCATDVGAVDGELLGDVLGDVLGEELGDVPGEELADALALGAELGKGPLPPPLLPPHPATTSASAKLP